MSPTRAEGTESAAGFPRVSGDEPGEVTRTLVWGEFSPRERG